MNCGSYYALSLLGMVLTLLAGCGRTGHDLAPVSGRVTLQDKPIANIGVTFQPIAKTGSRGDAGLGSYGTTDVSGQFRLKTIDGKPGAVVGNHKVYLTVQDTRPESGDVRSGPRPLNPFPSKAADGSLTFEVPPGGTEHASFSF